MYLCKWYKIEILESWRNKFFGSLKEVGFSIIVRIIFSDVAANLLSGFSEVAREIPRLSCAQAGNLKIPLSTGYATFPSFP